MSPPDPMIPFLAGWLCMAAYRDLHKSAQVVSIEPCVSDGFTVAFASGLRLRVTVSEIAADPPHVVQEPTP